MIIGSRVTIANDPDIGAFNTIEDDVTIGSLLETKSNVIIRKKAVIMDSVFMDNDVIMDGVVMDNDVIIGKAAHIGNDVKIGVGAIVRTEATIGDSVVIGEGALIRARADLPARFVIGAETVFPEDY